MTLNIGWIGCGRHAGAMLLPQLARLPVRLAAVCDRDPARAEDIAQRYGVPRRYTDHRDLLSAGGIDAVGIAVGPEAHVAMALDALAHGLPVFIEKPPGARATDAETLMAAADRARRPVCVGFMKRFATGYRIARNLVAADAFGPVLGFLGQYMTAPTYFADDRDDSGFYLHHCVHYMDLAPYLAGPVAAVRTRRFAPAPGKLLLHIDLDFASGAVGTLVLGTVQSRGTPMEFVQVMGDGRRVDVANVVEVMYHRDPPFKIDDPAATLDGDVDTLAWRPNLTAAANEDHKGYHALLAAFVGRLNGDAAEVPTIADGVAAMRLLDAVRKSAADGSKVEPSH